MLGGEPALTIVPNLLVTGILAVVVAAVAVGLWAVRSVDDRHGELVLVMLFVLLLLVAAVAVAATPTRPGRLPRAAPRHHDPERVVRADQ